MLSKVGLIPLLPIIGALIAYFLSENVVFLNENRGLAITLGVIISILVSFLMAKSIINNVPKKSKVKKEQEIKYKNDVREMVIKVFNEDFENMGDKNAK